MKKKSSGWNFATFICSCVFIVGICSYYGNKDSMTQEVDVPRIILQVIVGIFSFWLAWYFRNNWELGNFWTCFLGSGVLLGIGTIKELFFAIVNGFFIDALKAYTSLLPLLLIGSLLLAGVTFLVTHFIHIIYYKVIKISGARHDLI